jgi:tetratricopeptide (TPR) repeat protein
MEQFSRPEPESWQMKFGASLALLLLVTNTLGAFEPSLPEAHSRYLHGNYDEAIAIYQALATTAEHAISAAIGISRCRQSQGQYDDALAAIENLLKTHPSDADLLARHAELLHFVGRWEKAEKQADKALSAKPDHLLSRWVRSLLLRDRGEWTQADVDLRWFVRTYTERGGRKDEIKNPDELLLVGLAGAENARWHKMSDQFGIVLNDVFGDAIRHDRDYWPAEYQAGLLLLEKYNQAQAIEAFDKALAINPHAAEPLVGKGIAALQKYEVGEAESFALHALRINPRLPEARQLMADIHLLTGDIKAAIAELMRARSVNPRDENTLGRYAACLHLSHDESGFSSLVSEVTARDPRPAFFYYTLAEALEQRKWYEPAEKFYKKAMETQPWLPWPQNSLGLLYMRLGREAEARDVLSRALQADEFNVRVSNSLRVLRHLEKYQTNRTEHFEVRFDPQSDASLACYMAPYLEETYRRLAEQFHYQPAQRILIEIFSDHEMFSGRVMALPDLHTVGASSGRVVAIASPAARGIRGPFNWARVLRHELVHVFNLEQTRFQSPHWLTEGLAVIEEGSPRPQQWNELLVDRLATKQVLNLDNIELSFIRPRSLLDWHMAYCQSQLYVEYTVHRFGKDRIGAMLSAYRDGLGTGEVISKVCHVNKNEFENGYWTYLEEVCRSLPRGSNQRTAGYRQLQKQFEKNPDDPDLAAQMAEQCLVRQDKKTARRLADATLAKVPAHALASCVKARLLLEAGNDDEARSLLEEAVKSESPHPKVLQVLGKLYYESRDFAKAAVLYERGRRAQPQERSWLTHLLRIYTQTGDKEKQVDVLKSLAPMDADDVSVRKRLAVMLLESGRHAEAERYAKEALEIDVRDPETRDILVKALSAQAKNQEAERIRVLLAG